MRVSTFNRLKGDIFASLVSRSFAKKDFDYGPNPARAVHPMPKSVDTYAIESYQNEQYELYLFGC